ncbi:DNA polymerase III subunit gamma/tau [Methylibium sp. Root1272]|uniref:DNA polymerase III subunit gamma/tau n=1 Tax=Methylibium sp. Root1272 TaxID=1736441 RepID=UPI0006F30150|nr:DNA polymerase III subunit gamma/tau [Methylibium sp. Root1272]KQW66292.1 DNA polymerase III subunit gamma/tau [Methylibium sp. Root1272]
MSTLVLARKYRPRHFGEMVGQEHVVQALANALTSQRLHHAYLFTGTRGVGKTTVSRILAKSLNCTGPDGQGGITAHPCGVCPACRDIDAGRFVDYTELDAASNRGVDEISQLLEQSAYKPVVGRFKVFMIDEVHMLSSTAFNAMLKTLEEPPEYLKFVLATTDPQKVPVTVLSRCLQFNLRPMAPETVLAHLEQVLAAEGIAAEPGALRLLARGAHGSMRDALSLTDQAIAFGAGTLQEAGVRQMMGAVGRSHVYALIDALAAGDGAGVVATTDALRAEGLSAEGALEEMAVVLQQLALLQVVPDALDAADPDTAALAQRAGLLPADETQLLYSIALHGRAELALAPDEYSGLVMVLLRMLAFRPPGAARAETVVRPGQAAPAAAPPATVAVVRGPAPAVPLVRSSATASLAVAPPAKADPVPPPPAASGPASVPPWEEDIPLAEESSLPSVAMASRAAAPTAARGDAAGSPAPIEMTRGPLGDRWAALVRQLTDANAIAALVRELALQAECVAIDAGETRLRLRVERESLRNPNHAERLQAALTAALGHAVSLDIEAGAVNDTPARRDAAAREQRQREAEALIHNDPLVLQLTAQFKTARIVPGSIKPV